LTRQNLFYGHVYFYKTTVTGRRLLEPLLLKEHVASHEQHQQQA
jgi:hypothetical protein